jgi:hypothetical protein
VLPLPLGEPPQPVRLDPPTWLPGELGNQPPHHLRRHQPLAGGHHADSRAAAVMHEDRRFIAGVNLDGLFVGPVLDEGLSRPLLVFGSDYHDDVFDPSWAKVLPRLSGWHRWFRLVGSGHYRFIDLGGSVRKWGLDTTLKPADPGTWRTVFGDIDDALSQEIVVRVTTAFFERHLRHRSEPP